NRCADGVPCSEEEHQANRRTEFRILETASDYYGREPFNPDIFRDGEKIPVQVLDPDFFKGCLQTPAGDDTTVKEPAAETAKQAVSEQGTKPAALPETQQIPASVPGTELSVDFMSPDTATFFTVQIIANLTPIDMESAIFKGETGVFEKQIGNYFKYFTGMYGTYNEAASKRRQIALKFPGCFVVGFHEGRAVTSGELKVILNQ
ncbi:MAG: hypothetical protein WBK43_09520, partial [Prolixibacteraceae bacterium]